MTCSKTGSSTKWWLTRCVLRLRRTGEIVAAYPTLVATYERMLEAHTKERADLRHSLRVGPDEDVMKAIAQKTAAQTKILQAAVDMRKLEKETFHCDRQRMESCPT